jgi:demethylmenaquinone methyltransferase/2-methoxy-6-polyprenyl-1,4-benzoquinol methylase
MIEYYARRAREYDRIYERPERQADLARLTELVSAWARGERVLELACGTGWWTERLSRTAALVVAADLSPEVLAVAAERRFGPAPVELRRGDAFHPEALEGGFTAAVLGFLLSHVPRAAVPGLLDAVGHRLGPGGTVILFDNRWVEGSSTPLSRRDADGETYQVRRLENGTEFEVRKNFHDAAELHGFLAGRATDVELHELEYYWALRYRVRGPTAR